jgi:RNA-directed DNA polymerase
VCSFEAIPHSGLMTAIEERISDRRLLKLLRAMLRAGVMLDGAVKRSDTGTPQGGLCAAAHKDPYEQRWVMRSVRLDRLLRAGLTVERCA